MTYWIIIYSHKHGIDAWVEWGKDYPDEEAIKKEVDFVEDDEDCINMQAEVLDITGPFTIPDKVVAKIKAA